MGNFIRLALALSLSLMAMSASAAPTVEKVKVLPDVATMRYQARNHKTLFHSERSTNIDRINSLISSKKGIFRASSIAPDFEVPVSDQYEYIDGPDGSVYFSHAEFVTEDIKVNEYYTRKEITGYKFTVYDTKFEVVGEIKGKVRLDTTNTANPETGVASLGLTPIITKKFFNSDEKLEVMVYFNMNTPDYTVNSRSVAYQLGGAKDEEGYDVPLCTINGNLCDVLEANTSRWSEDFYLTFASDYTFPIADGDDSFGAYVNSMGAIIETYKKVGYGNSEPQKIFEYKMRLNDWPGDQESATPFISRCIDGKPYIIINGYTDGLWVFDDPGESGYSDQQWNENTNFFAEIYQPVSLENPNLLQRTEIDMKKSAGSNVFATFYYLGNLSYRDDVDFEYCDEPGKANFIITTKDWTGAEMGATSSYYLYAPDGGLIATLGQNIDGVLGMSDVKGHEPEFMFVVNDGGEYTFNFLNPFNGNFHHSFKQILSLNGASEGLYVNADRIADGDSYKYCFELSNLGMDDKGNDIMRMAWVDTDGRITGVDEVNMGKNVRMAKVYIEQSALSPYVFDTTPEREYMIIVKRGEDYSMGTQEEFIIGAAPTQENSVGKTLLEITPDNTRGNLMQAALLNIDARPMLWILFYNNYTDKYSQTFFNLPFQCFAGGEGSVENPYRIATIGDLQCIRDNLSAHYEIVNDIDATGYDFRSIGASLSPFTGTLKGNGHTVSNLTVDNSDYYNALFTYIDDAEISGITFVNPAVCLSGAAYNALVAAQAQRSTLSDIHVIGLTVDSGREGEFGVLVDKASLGTVISGCSVANASINLPEASVVGGIAADTRTGSSITACSFSGAVTASSVVGGILGTSGSNSGNISNCHVDADIAAQHIVGGIVGDMDQRIIIDHCYVEGNLSASETYGTRIVKKGYAVGGIAGSVSNFYDNNESSDEGAAAEAKNVITNCLVNLGSITVPELPEGHQSSVHRIAGFTSINNLEPDWDKVTDYDNIDTFLPTEAEAGFSNNFAVASLPRCDSAVEADAATTEGKDIDPYELDNEFFAGLGFGYGATPESPWKEVPENDPALYHEFATKFILDEISAVAGSSFDAELLVVSRRPMTADSFIDGFACEISDESIVEMSGEFSIDKNVAVIGFNALKPGNAEFTANVNGDMAKVKFNILAGTTGIGNIVSPESALAICFDGTTVSADDATLTVYSLDGKKVASDRNSLSLEGLTAGVYAVSATDTAGNTTTKKFILK